MKIVECCCEDGGVSSGSEGGVGADVGLVGGLLTQESRCLSNLLLNAGSNPGNLETSAVQCR